MQAEGRIQAWARARVARYEYRAVIYKRDTPQWEGIIADLVRLDNPRLKVLVRELLSCPEADLLTPREWREGRTPWSVEVHPS